MRVKLLYFGVLKDLAGESDAATELPDGSTVGELLRILRERTSKKDEMTERVWGSLAVAVNREYAAAGVVLREGDEVAMLPPVSGGAMAEGMSPGLKPQICGEFNVRAEARTYLRSNSNSKRHENRSKSKGDRSKSDGSYVG